MILGDQKESDSLEKSLPCKQQDFHSLCVFANLDIWNKFWAGVHSVSAGWPQQVVIPLLACYTLNKRILKCPGNGILAGFHGRSAFCLEIMVCNPREPRVIGQEEKFLPLDCLWHKTTTSTLPWISTLLACPPVLDLPASTIMWFSSIKSISESHIHYICCSLPAEASLESA